MQHIKVDGNNNVYNAGFYTGTVYFSATDSLTLQDTNDIAIYIVKYSPLGKVIWTKRIESLHNAIFNEGFEVNKHGDIWLEGTNLGSYAKFDTFSHKGNFIARLDSNGKFLWVKDCTSNGVYVDTLNNIYLLDNNFYKNDPSGNLVWSKKISFFSGSMFNY